MTLCLECGEPILDWYEAHTAHEESCDRDDWCRCDQLAHSKCCRQCRPVVIPGQVSLLDQIPTASTRGLPKLVHP